MANFKIEEFQLNTNYVIEASAGTGKTHNIVEIVKKLNYSGIPLDKILIVTYTEKAAGELKDRIRSVLPNENVDCAPIGTIHSFCQNTIKEFAIKSNLPLELKLIDEEELCDFVSQYVRKGQILADISKFKLAGLDCSIGKISKNLVAGVKKYYLNSNYEEDLEVIQQADLSINDDYYLGLRGSYTKIDNISELFLEYPEIQKNLEILEKSAIEEMRTFAETMKIINKKSPFNYDERSKKYRYTYFVQTEEEFNAVKYLSQFKDYNSSAVKAIMKNIANGWDKIDVAFEYPSIDDVPDDHIMKKNYNILKNYGQSLDNLAKEDLVIAAQDIAEMIKVNYHQFANFDKKKYKTTSFSKVPEVRSAYEYFCDVYDKIKNEAKFSATELELFQQINGCVNFEDLASDSKIKQMCNVLSNSQDREIRKLVSEVMTADYSEGTVKISLSTNNCATFAEYLALGFFKDLKSNLKSIDPDIAIAKKYLRDVYICWQEKKLKNKTQTFGDMIRSIREALINGKSDALELAIKEKYTYAIIDEFQDTNQLQFDIFRKIFLSDNHNLIVVGDPKQSIYSFQGADVYVYNKAIEQIAQNGIKCELIKNYRSTYNIVDLCNKLFSTNKFLDNYRFSTALKHGDDEKYFDVKYDDLDTKGFWVVKSEDGKTIDDSNFARSVVEIILDCCEYVGDKTRLQVKDKDGSFRNVSFRDFTILVRDRKKMLPFQFELQNAGIPFVKYKDNSLFNGIECAHWIALLESIDVDDFSGKNRDFFYKALFTKFFGYSIKDISSPTFKLDNIEPMQLIENWKSLAQDRRWVDLIDSIITTSYLNNNLKSLSEIQMFGIFKQIGDFAIDYLSNNQTLESLIKKLKTLAKGSLDDGDENGAIVDRSTNFDCVQMMTIHASKGLQFPIVICAETSLPGGRDGAFAYHNNQKKYLSYYKNDYCDLEIEEELKRIYYVAYTRAQYLNIIPNSGSTRRFLNNVISEFVKNYENELNIIHPKTSNYIKLRQKAQAILEKNKKETNNTRSQIEQLAINKSLISTQFTKSTFKRSYSSLSHAHSKEEILDDPLNIEGVSTPGLSGFDQYCKKINIEYSNNEPISLSEDFPRGSSLGSALHEIFEIIDYSNMPNEDDLRAIIGNCFNRQGIKIKEEWISDSQNIVSNVVGSRLPVIHGSSFVNDYISISQITNVDKLVEAEFSFRLITEKYQEQLHNYCNGFIDLLFRQGQYYSILDWKSDSLNEDFEAFNNYDSLQKRVNEHYSIQRVLYSYCLIKWLKSFYPDLSEGEIFEKHFGGIYYVFLRGCNKETSNGIYAQTWDSYVELEKAFNEIIDTQIGGR